MKNTKLVLACFGLMALAFSSCKLEGGNQEPCEDCDKYKGEKPKTTINYKQAITLQKEYLETRSRFLNKYLNEQGIIEGDDVREVWYDLETIKQYISYVEAQAKKKGYENLGMRVYFGAYPKEANMGKPGYSTAFFVPTFKRKNSGMNLVYQDGDDNVNMTDVDGLNYGQGGNPPRDLN
jgi:hypothetical protein